MAFKKKKKKISKNKRITKEGKVWYYYRKRRKPGPRKKPGPKKRKKISWVRRVYLPWDFKIILCSNKKQTKYIGRYHNEIEVVEAKNELLVRNFEVILPAEHINNGRVSNSIENWDLEYLILKKVNKSNSEINNTRLPNKYGKMVEHVTNSEDWYIWDKFPCLVEEKFWVYGYNKVTDRKDTYWIFQNLIENKLESKYDILRIFLYNNKLVIIDDYNHIDFVICKNISDGIRLYNVLQSKLCVKLKNVLFSGRTSRTSELQSKIIELIQKKTNWKLKDIYRSSTRH